MSAQHGMMRRGQPKLFDFCRIDGCPLPVHVKNVQLCNAHYIRMKRHGDLMEDVPPRLSGRTPAARFWAKVEKTDECWEWTGAKDSAGYGMIGITGASTTSVRTHVLSAWMHHGTPPPKAYVCHHCDNRACVRPDHIYYGSAKTNAHDMISRGRAGPQVGRVAEWTWGRATLPR